ncbi:MAG: ribonuclease Z [Patescibacteria group bacterium]|jgi:ribonuclease BN (tRNA processing enzyme)
MSLKVLTLGSGVCANKCLPGPRRYPPGFLIDYDGQLLLLDVSEGVRFRLEDAGYDYGKVAHVAISHVHPDHADLSPFLQAKLCRTLWCQTEEGMEKLDVYLNETSIAGFEQTWQWRHPEAAGKLNHFPEKFNFTLQPLRGGWEKEIFKGLTLKAFGVYHGFGQHPALGFRIEVEGKSIVYTGDAGLTESLFTNVEKADLLIADCGTRIGQEYTGGYGHMGPGQCGMLAFRGQVKELWLTHYVGFDTPAAMEAEARKSGFSGIVKVVTDGLIWQQK